MKEARPKIAIILSDMSIGGIPKAVIPLMRQLVRYADVTLIQTTDQGELQDQIPQNVKTIVAPYERTRYLYSKLISERKPINALLFRTKTLFLGHVSKRWVINNAYIAKHADLVSDVEYDCAIAFHGMNIDHLTRTLYQVKAKKRIAWIHGDHPFTGKHLYDAAKLYAEFDRIFCVSKATKESFLQAFPTASNLTEVFYNLFDIDMIRKMADEPCTIPASRDWLCFVTVGRISHEKGQELIPPIAERLKKEGYRFRWYIVGDGPDRSRIELLSKNHRTGDVCVFTGMQTNPYPYIKNCDIYIQPSYTEGYPLTIFEAVILSKPIVATDVGGAGEHLSPGEKVIYTKVSTESIYTGIVKMISNLSDVNFEAKRHQLDDCSNISEVVKILNLI